MKRLAAVFTAVVLAGLGVFASSSAEAHADVPTWPTCLRTPLGDGQVRVWFNPGNLYADPSRVVIGTQRDDKTVMRQRRDGVWVATDRPTEDATYYFTMRSSDGVNGAWTRCKKVMP